MAPKSSSRLEELRRRASAMVAQPRPAGAEEDASTPPAAGPVNARSPEPQQLNAHFGIAALDQAVTGRVIQRVPVGHIAPDVRPGQRQPRLLPSPEELVVQGEPAPGYSEVVTALLELGRSMQARQIQPIVIYPGSSAMYPAARYLILVGHRRWTAAMLVGLESIDGVVVDPPSSVDRVRLQYAENEDRADFSDMERVWALQQMKQALGDVSWDVVEEQFQMSRGRRQELLRLAAFTPEQQTQLARLRLRETQLRPLHTALRSQELDASQVDAVLAQLDTVARGVGPAGARSLAVDGPTIARLVTEARQQALIAPAPLPVWLRGLHEQLERTQRSLVRARKRVQSLGDSDVARLEQVLQQVRARLDEVAGELAHGDRALRPRTERAANQGDKQYN